MGQGVSCSSGPCRRCWCRVRVFLVGLLVRVVAANRGPIGRSYCGVRPGGQRWYRVRQVVPRYRVGSSVWGEVTYPPNATPQAVRSNGGVGRTKRQVLIQVIGGRVAHDSHYGRYPHRGYSSPNQPFYLGYFARLCLPGRRPLAFWW